MISDASRYAGIVSRGMAFVADATIVVTLSVCLVGAIEVVGSALGAAGRRTPVALLAATPPVLFVVYNTFCWALTGRTPGMALFGVRVIRTRDRPLSWGVALVRALAFALLWWAALWSLLDARRQALHDKVAGTLVVYDPQRVRGSPVTGDASVGTEVAASWAPPGNRRA